MLNLFDYLTEEDNRKIENYIQENVYDLYIFTKFVNKKQSLYHLQHRDLLEVVESYLQMMLE